MHVSTISKFWLFICVSTLLSGCGGGEEPVDQIPIIPVVDTTPPTVTLNGEGSLSLYAGETYLELGATATDYVDGDIAVTVSGELDTNNAGLYTLIYTATDSAGNKHSVTRSIEVVYLRPFITTWDTAYRPSICANNICRGLSDDHQVTIGASGYDYDYSVDWGDGETDSHVTGDITHTYSSPGVYTVTISGRFPHLYFEERMQEVDPVSNQVVYYLNSDGYKLQTVEQWGDYAWQSMAWAFSGSEQLVFNTTDVPDLSNVTNMGKIFSSSGLSTDNYDALLDGWSRLLLTDDVDFGAGSIQYSLSSQAARDVLTDTYNWTITDGGVSP